MVGGAGAGALGAGAAGAASAPAAQSPPKGCGRASKAASSGPGGGAELVVGVVLFGAPPVAANAMAGTAIPPRSSREKLDAAAFERLERVRRLAARKAACLTAVPRRRLAIFSSSDTEDPGDTAGVDSDVADVAAVSVEPVSGRSSIGRPGA